MKKLFFLLTIIFLMLAVQVQAANVPFRIFTELQGGTDSMDSIDCQVLAEGYLALGYDLDSDNVGFYWFDDGDTTAELAPSIIRPDNYGTCTDGVWKGVANFFLGAEDNEPGVLNLYGGGTGEDGGELYWYLGADDDTTIQYYGLLVVADDIQLGPDTDPNLVLLSAEKDLYLTDGDLYIRNPSDDIATLQIGQIGQQRGKLQINADNTGSQIGGILVIQTADDYDASIAWYQLYVAADDFELGPNIDQDSLIYKGDTDIWNFTGTGVQIDGTLDLTGAFTQQGSATPQLLLRDSNALGTDPTDEDTAKILANMETTTEDAEDGKLSIQVMRDASFVTAISADGNLNETVIGDNTFSNQILGKSAGANDGVCDGLMRTYTVDSGVGNTAFLQAYHVDTDGELIDADADATATMPALGLACETGTGSKQILLQGLICETNLDMDEGDIIYISTDPTDTSCEAAGNPFDCYGVTDTAPSGTGDQIQVVGIAVSPDCIEVNMGGYVLVEVP